MSIETAINSISEKSIRNIEQLPTILQNAVLSLKTDWLTLYGFSPKLKLCLHILKENIVNPPKCQLKCCDNFILRHGHDGLFSTYCCNEHRWQDKEKLKKQYEKHLKTIDHNKKCIKSAATRKQKIDPITGLNGFDLAIKKAVQTRESNDTWYTSVCRANKSYSNEKRYKSVEKRINTIEKKYGVSHFGNSGFSVLKKKLIHNVEFLTQGYEDVEIYDLISSGINPNDILMCNQRKEFAIFYEDAKGHKRRYFPDIKIISQNKFIEVKSLYWYERDKNNIHLKLQAAKDQNIDIELKIIERKHVDKIRKNITIID